MAPSPKRHSPAPRPARSLRPVAPVIPHAPPGTAPVPAALPPSRSPASWDDLIAYQRDVWERAVLFWDTLRQRADNMLEHDRLGLPPLLKFKSEMQLDARTLEHPVNYALLRITEVDDQRADECIRPERPPVVILDPRAGHGPGIGGFKRESEVGMALREGHPVYFVVFFPEPCPGQTLADVHHALRRFVEAVAKLHPGQPPILYGNCQAGWAITLLSADCEGLVGTAVLNGSPLSYWAGESGVNPMRIAAGLLGGAWLTHLMADLGDGRFDGAWLVQNFEALKPGNALWDKYATLFTHIDTERERFLDFERWWTGFYMLGREEILAIVENLFIGNLLEQGKFRICDGCTADLTRIRNPLVIFASYGDNITPPHQALGWISAVYKTTDELRRAGQRIVYLTNPHVGHLGIFVSASVAKLEHRAILEHLAEIGALAPGLYEMKIDNPTGDPDCHRPHYTVRFEARTVEALRFDYPHAAFARVRQVSELNETVYRAFVSPWVRAASNPWSAAAMKWLHPMRTSRYLLSGAFMPWMRGLQTLAEAIASQRHPLPDDNPLLSLERETSAGISDAFDCARVMRDAAQEHIFSQFYNG